MCKQQNRSIFHFITRDTFSLLFWPIIYSNTYIKKAKTIHNTDFHYAIVYRVLIEGVKYNAEKPSMIGKTFLRLERDFDKHVIYCRDEPNAQEFLHERKDVREYFQVIKK